MQTIRVHPTRLLVSVGVSIVLPALLMSLISLRERQVDPTQAVWQIATPMPSPSPIVAAQITYPPSPLAAFPLSVGNTWVYSDTEYENFPSDSNATYIITQTVLGTVRFRDYFVASVFQKQKMLSSTPNWAYPSESNDLFAYVVRDRNIYAYRSGFPLWDPSAFELSYPLPLYLGKTWCPYLEAKGNCVGGGQRTVIRAQSYQVPAGRFNNCFQWKDDFLTGTDQEWFCNGVGIVENQFDHNGAPFGQKWILMRYYLR